VLHIIEEGLDRGRLAKVASRVEAWESKIYWLEHEDGILPDGTNLDHLARAYLALDRTHELQGLYISQYEHWTPIKRHQIQGWLAELQQQYLDAALSYDAQLASSSAPTISRTALARCWRQLGCDETADRVLTAVDALSIWDDLDCDHRDLPLPLLLPEVSPVHERQQVYRVLEQIGHHPDPTPLQWNRLLPVLARGPNASRL
jgi:hypothetical protein